VRFDLLGNIFYLTPNDCVVDDQNNQFACSVKDFEVTAGKVIHAINLSPTDSVVDNQYLGTRGYYLKRYASSNVGLTLLRDQPILINQNY